MSKVPAASSRIYFDEFAFSSYLTSYEQMIRQELAKVDTFADAGPRRIVGNHDYDLSHLGLFEPTDDEFDEQAFAAINDSDDHYFTHLPEGSAENTVAYDFAARLEGQPRLASAGGAVLLNMQSKGSLGASRGLVLGSVTTTGAENRTGRNMGATSANTIFRVVFRVLTFSGTNITLKLQESQNDGSPDTYGDISGLTSGALTAKGVVAAQTTSATEAWKRLNIAGTFSSALILVTAGSIAGT